MRTSETGWPTKRRAGQWAEYLPAKILERRLVSEVQVGRGEQRCHVVLLGAGQVWTLRTLERVGRSPGGGQPLRVESAQPAGGLWTPTTGLRRRVRTLDHALLRSARGLLSSPWIVHACGFRIVDTPSSSSPLAGSFSGFSGNPWPRWPHVHRTRTEASVVRQRPGSVASGLASCIMTVPAAYSRRDEPGTHSRAVVENSG